MVSFVVCCVCVVVVASGALVGWFCHFTSESFALFDADYGVSDVSEVSSEMAMQVSRCVVVNVVKC